MSDFNHISSRVAARYKMAYFEVGDRVTFGKWKNKPGILKRMWIDDRGVPMIEIDPLPAGRKQPKVLSLYNIRKAPEAAKVAAAPVSLVIESAL